MAYGLKVGDTVKLKSCEQPDTPTAKVKSLLGAPLMAREVILDQPLRGMSIWPESDLTFVKGA